MAGSTKASVQTLLTECHRCHGKTAFIWDKSNIPGSYLLLKMKVAQSHTLEVNSIWIHGFSKSFGYINFMHCKCTILIFINSHQFPLPTVVHSGHAEQTLWHIPEAPSAGRLLDGCIFLWLISITRPAPQVEWRVGRISVGCSYGSISCKYFLTLKSILQVYTQLSLQCAVYERTGLKIGKKIGCISHLEIMFE